MTLKDYNRSPANGGFRFFYKKPDGESSQVHHPSSIEQLVVRTVEQFRNNGMEVPENLRQIVEHQICLRQPNPLESCWSGGLGDDIHHKWISPFLSKVEKLSDKMVKGRKGIFAKVVAAVGGVARAIRKCGDCGGRKTYEQGKNNLGRAGTLNRISRK